MRVMKVRRPRGISISRSLRILMLPAICSALLSGQAAPPVEARPQTPAHSASMVGKPAPLFMRRTLDGRLINLSRLRGKVVLLNFWATWCAPCQSEMPTFNTWLRQYGGLGFEVVGISMDDDADAARSLVSKLRLDYPVAMGDAAFGRRYGGVLGLPTTFLIDRRGRVVQEFQGGGKLNSLEHAVKAALK